MKKITLTLIAISLFIVKSTKAQEEDLIASEPISSGCLSQTRGAEESALPTIKLTKEGSILSVDLLNYSSNCGTTGFEVENRMIGGNNDTPSVVISVVPVIPAPMDCICPFNISYTVRGLEKNKFYLTCWWFDGQVELTEGEPLVLEYKTEDVVIDGLKYRLLKTSHQAKLLYQIPWNNEAEIIQIPSEVEYEGENYTVTTIVEELFGSNNTIKKIIIPKTIKNTEFGSLEEIPSNPFSSCLSLETIEVEEGSPVFSSVDGVLFSTDKKTLIGYPAGSPRESYTVPDGVKTAKIAAFFNSQHLKKIVLTNDMETLGLSVFGYGKNLEEVILSSNIKELPSYIFRNCKKLNSVFIPKGVTTIASSAFEGCISLESISLPESVATVGTAAFMGCTSLESATLSPNLKVIPTAMFRDCSKLAEVIIPFGITTIGNGAFAGCKAMRSFDLPESINYIDDYAFRYLSDLKDIYCHAKTAPNTSKNAFWNVDLSHVTLHVPEASIENYQSSSLWNQFKAIVSLEADPQGHHDTSYYYYYQGKKIPLTLNENKVVVSIPKEYDEIDKRIRANVQVLLKINDESFDIIVISRPNFEALTSLDFWGEDAKSVILTSSYYTETNEEVFATPYLNVRLKNEQDIDLLNSYAEEYRLRIAGKSAFMPWYILAVTPESEKSPLEIANELFESGNFAASVPELADGSYNPEEVYSLMIEDGKVWKVGDNSGNPVKLVEYYYFDGDTIIDGKTCKQMMCQRYASPDHPDYDTFSQLPSLSYVGAWYEENKQVYLYDATNNQFMMMYDFSLEDHDIQLMGDYFYIGPRETGGIEGFKGIHRDVFWSTLERKYYSTTWLDGVGGIDGPIYNIGYGKEYHPLFLMSCTVGDEVIYLNDALEDGATPEAAGARNRFDFTHTIKTKPKAPRRSEDERSVYGEYDKLQLGINLNLLADDYVVRITDDSGNVIYEKAVNASTIVGLNIDISGYAKGHYTVTVENSQESFTGEFNTLPTGIEETTKTSEVTSPHIYNLQGQRISSLQKGLNIVNGQKVYVK